MRRFLLTDQEFLTTDEVAEIIRLKPQTLAKMRLEGRGPCYIKAGRLVIYQKSDVLKWIEEQRRTSTSDTAQSTLPR